MHYVTWCKLYTYSCRIANQWSVEVAHIWGGTPKWWCKRENSKSQSARFSFEGTKVLVQCHGPSFWEASWLKVRLTREVPTMSGKLEPPLGDAQSIHVRQRHEPWLRLFLLVFCSLSHFEVQNAWILQQFHVWFQLARSRGKILKLKLSTFSLPLKSDQLFCLNVRFWSFLPFPS